MLVSQPQTPAVSSSSRAFGAATVPPHDHLAFAGDAAAREIIAGVALWGGEAGLEELAADLALQLSGLIEQLAAVQGRSAVEVAEDLFA